MRDLFSRTNNWIVVFILVLAMSTFLKVYFVENYVTYTDEILSAVVADSISKTGFPLLPSNTYYTRALLHHYLLAIPIGLFGMDYLPMRLNSILFSLFVIIMIYLLGKELTSQKMGIVAASILSVSTLFIQFALSGRMYMTYTLFFILTVYLFYAGFVNGRSTAKWMMIPAMAGTMLSSEAGILIGPVLGFLIIFYYWKEWWRDRAIYVGIGVWIVLFWFTMIFDYPNTYQSFTAHSGVSQPSLIHAGMSLKEIIGNLIFPWRALDKALPFSMSLFLIMIPFIIMKGEFRRHYPIVVLLPVLIVGSFLTYRIQHRVIIGWLPLYFLACCQLLWTLNRWAREALIKETVLEDSPFKIQAMLMRNKFKLIAGTVGSIVILLGVVVLNKLTSPENLGDYVVQSFGYHDSRANENLEPSYQYLESHVGSEDSIVVTTVEYGLFFLGPQYDYFYLRQKKVNTGAEIKYIAFDKPKEPYYGKPLIDSIDKLQKLIEKTERPLWVVADYKTDSYVGSEMKGFIENEFELVFDDYQDNRSKVYRKLPDRV